MPLYRFEQLSRLLALWLRSRTRVDRLAAWHSWLQFGSWYGQYICHHIKMHYHTIEGALYRWAVAFIREIDAVSANIYHQNQANMVSKYFGLSMQKTTTPLSGAKIYLRKVNQIVRETGVCLRSGAETRQRLPTILVTTSQWTTCSQATNWRTILSKKIHLPWGRHNKNIKSSNRFVLEEFSSAEEAKKRGAFASVFCYSNAVQLKRLYNTLKKNVLLLSSAPATDNINARTRKPEVIHDYNKTKGGVDTFDKMVRGYSCKRKSNRWPMTVFSQKNI